MWNFLDDLKKWYEDRLNDYGVEDKYAIWYVNAEYEVRIPFEFVGDIVRGVFGTQDVLDDTRNELDKMRIFNDLLIEKIQLLEEGKNNEGNNI